MRSGPTNTQLVQLLSDLKQQARESNFWRRIAKDLNKPSRQRRSINVYKIDKSAKEGEMIIVPGKVLSLGEISKKVDVAAFQFSSEAKRKIQQANGRTLSISQLLKENPQGKKVRILG